MYTKDLHFFTGTTEELSPDMNEVMLIKSVHIIQFL
jgi:hypothetical protein